MPRKKPSKPGPETAKELSGLQAAVMRVLWERGQATVAEVQEALEQDRPLAHNTVATVLTRLSREGVVAGVKEGRSYVYRPLLQPSQARRSMVGALVRRLFEGEPVALASHLVREAELGTDDLDELEGLIREKRRAIGKQK
jgi:predicted transcriptional regulator